MPLLREPLHLVAKTNAYALYCLQNATRVPFVVKLKSKRKSYHLLYEGRFLRQGTTGQAFDKKFGAWHVTFDADGNLKKLSKKPRSCPKTHLLPRGADQGARLAELAGVPDDGSADPSTFEETVQWLTARGLTQRVKITFCVRLLRHPVDVYWVHPGRPAPGQRRPSYDEFVFLHAYTGRDNRLCFRRPPVARERPGRKPAAPDELPAEEATVDAAAGLSKSNRSCGASVHLAGLTKALKLGMLAGGRDFLLAANSELCRAAATIWLHHDAGGEVRHAGYRDGLGFHASFEIFPGYFDSGRKVARVGRYAVSAAESWASWKALFDCMWQRRLDLLAHKEKFLGPLVAAWSGSCQQDGRKKKKGGSYDNCVSSLRACLAKTRVVCFCQSDQLLHSLKVPLAHYLATALGQKGSVTLRTVGNTKIVCLVSKDVEIENAANILGLKCCEDGNQFVDDGEELLSVLDEWRVPRGEACQPPLPPKPLLSAQAPRLFKSEIAYSPGRVGDRTLSQPASVRERASRLTAATLELYSEFCAWICRSYNLDLATSPYMSLSSLAYKCVWLSLSEKGGGLFQSLEKTKPAYAALMRQHCRGGFAYSFRGALSAGQPVCEGGEPAASVREYDLTSAYGYSMQNMSVPGGFCVGYSARPAEGGGDGLRLARTDKVNRAGGFEFSATLALCARLQGAGEKIEAAWHNYSPLGLCYLGRYPVDLAAVLESGVTLFVNFDGQFAHGCRAGTCRPLPRYASDKTLAEVLQQTRERDANIEAWVREANATGRLKCVYRVFSNCHDPDFDLKTLRDPALYPNLALLRRPYDHLPRGDIESADFFLSVPDDLTFLLVGRGGVPEEARTRERGPPLFVWKEAAGGAERGRRFYQDFGWETEEDALFTKDSLKFLSETFGFRLTRVTHCLFYRRCSVLPRVFSDLTAQRQQLADRGMAAKAKFLKSIVNYSTGMFGFNPEKRAAYATARLMSHVTRRTAADLGRRKVTFSAQAGSRAYFVLQTRPKPLRQTPVSVSLPIYCSVVEYGKARLAACHTFLTRCARPGAYRCLYSNTDNLVCALSSETLEGVVRDSSRDTFVQSKDDYFGAAPGLLSEKWSISTPASNWEFASPYPCHYSVALRDAPESPPEGERCKASGFSDVSPTAAHLASTRLLRGGEGPESPKLSHPQKRRINRLANTDTRDLQVRVPKLQRLN